MRMLALKCESCGAPIDLPANTFEAECLYCNSRILIEQSPPAGTSIAKPSPPKSPPSLSDKIAQLDREWEAYRGKYLEKTQTGEYDIPVEEHCRMGIWATVILAAIGIVVTALSGPPAGFAISLLILACAGITVQQLRKQIHVARVYARSKRNYEQERIELLKEFSSK